MNRTVLAALLAFGVFALARADEGAYKNLVGMAQAAATDRGPDPEDGTTRPDASKDGLKDAIADVPAPKSDRTAAPDAVPAPAFVPDAAPAAVLVPPARKPRLWTRLYATLLPSWRRPRLLSSAFEPAASTGTFRAPAPLPALMPPPDSEAVKAGERRGLAELLNASASPADGQ